MEQLDEGSEDDWKGCFRVNFIGEEGLDAGGLRREFFSLLFEKSDLLENNSFCLDAAKLAKKHYKLLGKATALAILYGHPGPQCFNQHITQYIVSGVEPEEVQLQSIKRQDIVSAVNDVSFKCCNCQFDSIILYYSFCSHLYPNLILDISYAKYKTFASDRVLT